MTNQEKTRVVNTGEAAEKITGWGWEGRGDRNYHAPCCPCADVSHFPRVFGMSLSAGEIQKKLYSHPISADVAISV